MVLSTRQTTILEFIRSEIVKKGYPPTVREIGDAVGLASSSTVHGHLDRIEKKGLIRRDASKPRAIEVVDQDERYEDADLVRVPIVGKVTAGEPILAVQHIEDYFVMKRERVASETFVLKVKGESMIEAGIHDGDFLIVSRQITADNGDMVVAMTPQDEVTVKTFYKENGYYRLQPENSNMKPLILKEVRIVGKVKGIFRIMK